MRATAGRSPDPIALATAMFGTAVFAAGCASGGGGDAAPHPFDVHYGAGDWELAAAAFEADPALALDDWAVYRAGLIYARPDSELFDPQNARRILEDFIERYPDSRYAAPATVVIGLIAEVGEGGGSETGFHADSSASTFLDDWSLYRAGLTYAHPDSELFDAESVNRILGMLIDRYPESRYAEPAGVVIGLVAELGRSARAAAALRQQLDQLKRVDLKPIVPPPPPPPAPPGRD